MCVCVCLCVHECVFECESVWVFVAQTFKGDLKKPPNYLIPLKLSPVHSERDLASQRSQSSGDSVPGMRVCVCVCVCVCECTCMRTRARLTFILAVPVNGAWSNGSTVHHEGPAAFRTDNGVCARECVMNV